MLATRGCPYLCQFCDAPAIWGRVHRRRSVANVLDELQQIYNEFDVRYIRFVDDLLVANKKWAIQLCRGILGRGLDELSWACDGRVGLMSEELLQELKEANCNVIFYGIEFGNQRILDFCKKGFTVEQVRQTIELTSKVGISSYGYFMMGYPTETTETIEDTINLAIELALDYGMDTGWVKCSCMCKDYIKAVARAINLNAGFEFSSTFADGDKYCEGVFKITEPAYVQAGCKR